jgi:hypothetical protein
MEPCSRRVPVTSRNAIAEEGPRGGNKHETRVIQAVGCAFDHLGWRDRRLGFDVIRNETVNTQYVYSKLLTLSHPSLTSYLVRPKKADGPPLRFLMAAICIFQSSIHSRQLMNGSALRALP